MHRHRKHSFTAVSVIAALLNLAPEIAGAAGGIPHEGRATTGGFNGGGATSLSGYHLDYGTVRPFKAPGSAVVLKRPVPRDIEGDVFVLFRKPSPTPYPDYCRFAICLPSEFKTPNSAALDGFHTPKPCPPNAKCRSELEDAFREATKAIAGPQVFNAN